MTLELPAYVRSYVHRLLHEAGTGMKALLVDAETMGVVSTVMTQTEILQKEVFLVERLDKPGADAMMHLKAVCFLRPTSENVGLLRRQLREPRYGEFHVFFTNIVRDSLLQELADADESELVRQVQEFYADYLAVDPTHFTLDVPSTGTALMPPSWNVRAAQRVLDRSVEGLAALLLTLKRRPVVRYQQSSERARRLAQDLSRLAYEQEAGLFDFRRAEPTLLLVIDRLDDPVTPLLSQWTYQAMIHELVGVRNNRVDLSHVAKQPTDQREVVLSSEQDAFFKGAMYDNFGDLGNKIRALVEEFQVVSKSNQNIQSIEDMQRFVENYPEFRAKSGNVSKHVNMMGELSRVVDSRHLYEVSPVEQELACGSERNSAYDSIVELLQSNRVREQEQLRLVMLFALRYEKDGQRQLDGLISRLENNGVGRRKVALVRGLLGLAGETQRTGDLYGSRSFFARASKMVDGLKGVDNVYTQHTPLLASTLDQVAKGKLKESEYPYATQPLGAKERPSDVIVFITGGTTYEEARAVAQLNAAAKKDGSGMRVLLGGSSILNTEAFVEGMLDAIEFDTRSGRY